MYFRRVFTSAMWLFGCLLVCQQDYPKITGQISTNVGWRIGLGQEQTSLTSGVDLIQGMDLGISSHFLFKIFSQGRMHGKNDLVEKNQTHRDGWRCWLCWVPFYWELLEQNPVSSWIKWVPNKDTVPPVYFHRQCFLAEFQCKDMSWLNTTLSVKPQKQDLATKLQRQ